MVYSGVTPVEERMLDTTSHVFRRYYYEAAINKPVLVEEDANGDGDVNDSADHAFILLTDDRGTVMGVITGKGSQILKPDQVTYHDAGDLIEKLYYNATGLIRSYDAADNLNDDTGEDPYRSQYVRYGWTGMYKDAFTGRYHTHFRDYDPVHNPGAPGLSEDPAGYMDGLNLYANYAGVNGVDALGLVSRSEVDEAVANARAILKSIFQELEALGRLSEQGSANTSEVDAQVDRIYSLYNDYLKAMQTAMRISGEFAGEQWYFSKKDERSFNAVLDMPMGVAGLKASQSQMLASVEANDAAHAGIKTAADRANTIFVTAQWAEHGCTAVGMASGVGAIAQQAIKLGAKEGTKFILKQAAKIAISEVAGRIFGGNMERLAEACGVDVKYIRAGMVVLQAVQMTRSFRAVRAANVNSATSSSASVNLNGNSKLSTNAQHGYEIYDTHTGKVVKTGVSGQPLNKNGSSSRANGQVNNWNKEPGNEGRYQAQVVKQVPEGPGARQEILDWEKQNAQRLRDTGELDIERHTRP